MRFGLKENIIEKIVQVFEANPKIDKAFVFGSRAKGNYRPDSDIDIAIKGYDISIEDILTLSVALDEQGIGHHIDLIDYNVIKEELLREHIDRVGVEFYGRWKEYKISTTSEILTGFAFKSDEYEATGNLKVVRGENVTLGVLRWDSEKHWNRPITGFEKYLLKENDIVVGMDGSRVGRNKAIIKKNELPLILAQRVALLRAKTDFSQKYIWYNIFSKQFTDYVESIHTGTSIPHISQSQIGDYKILAPQKKEQESISKILNALDDKIDLLKNQNKTLEQLGETIFRKWFIECIDENPKLGKLGELVDFTYGKTLKEEDRSGDGYPVVGSSGIVGYHDAYLVEAPGIVTGRKGTLGQVNYMFDNFTPIDTTYYITSKVNSKGLFFDYFLLKSINLLDFNTDSAVPGLNRHIALSAEIRIPEYAKINQFNEAVEHMFQKIRSNQTQIQTLTKLRDTLLPKLMSGEIRVKM